MPEIKERPILFSGAMVRAILNGSKTVTRRPVKRLALKWLEDGFDPNFVADPENSMCPYGNPGDRLWVRETWARVGNVDPGYLTYRATYPSCLPPGLENVPADLRDAGERWRPSIHMPRSACRILLEVTDVRIERLQEIDDYEAIAEGVKTCEREIDPDFNGHSPAALFSGLWEMINGEGSWNANPWVWVVEFQRIHQH